MEPEKRWLDQCDVEGEAFTIFTDGQLFSSHEIFHKKELQSKAVLNGWKRWMSMSNYFGKERVGGHHLFNNCEKMFFFPIWNLIIPDSQRFFPLFLCNDLFASPFFALKKATLKRSISGGPQTQPLTADVQERRLRQPHSFEAPTLGTR